MGVKTFVMESLIMQMGVPVVHLNAFMEKSEMEDRRKTERSWYQSMVGKMT